MLVEDTSLHFNALNGLPGPYIKWFLDKIGHVGLNNLLAAYTDKSAYAQVMSSHSFVTNKSFLNHIRRSARSDSWTHRNPRTIKVFVGKTDGNDGARGPTTFGWDPVFEPKESHGKTR